MSALAALAALAVTQPVELGVWAPRVLPGDPIARAEWARRAGEQLSAAAGFAVDGRAFSAFGDLETFVRSGRLTLVLVDPLGALALGSDGRVLGQGTGVEGPEPRLAVLTRGGERGVATLAGKSLGVVRSTSAEWSLVAQLGFFGQLDPSTYFGLRRESELDQLAEWVQADTLDGMVAYQAQAGRWGLKVTATLGRLPLPVLLEVRGGLTDPQRTQLSAALRGEGVVLPEVPGGLLGRVQALSKDYLASVRKALDGGPGPQRAVWAPGASLSIDPELKPVPRKLPPLEPPRDRIRVPDFPAVE